MILDSSFLIDLLASDAGAVANLDELSERLLAVPTIAYTEVAIGFDPSGPEAQQFESVMEEATLVAYDGQAARRAVDLQRQLRGQGNPIGAVDAMTAGTAIARDEPIVTRNAGEFSRTQARISPY